MSDESSDDDYCPTQTEEKEFEKVSNEQSIEQTATDASSMTKSQSDAADEIFKSFKDYKAPKHIDPAAVAVTTEEVNPIDRASARHPHTVLNTGQSGNITRTVTKEYDFAGETVTVEEAIPKRFFSISKL